MDEELRAYLDQQTSAQRQYLDQQMSEQRQYLDQQMSEQRQYLDQQMMTYQDHQRAYLEKQFSRVDDQFRDVEHRLGDRIEVTETRLLTEFHKWARTYEIRMRAVSTQTRFFEERLDAIEDRVANLEKKP